MPPPCQECWSWCLRKWWWGCKRWWSCWQLWKWCWWKCWWWSLCWSPPPRAPTGWSGSPQRRSATAQNWDFLSAFTSTSSFYNNVRQLVAARRGKSVASWKLPRSPSWTYFWRLSSAPCHTSSGSPGDRISQGEEIQTSSFEFWPTLLFRLSSTWRGLKLQKLTRITTFVQKFPVIFNSYLSIFHKNW